MEKEVITFEMQHLKAPQIIVSSFNTWHMDHAAKAYELGNNLIGLYTSINNNKGIKSELFHRALLFHILMKPFYHFTSPLIWQKIQYKYFMSFFDNWFKGNKLPAFNVIQAIAWGAKAPFDIAEKYGALKVLDAPNSYPTNYDAIERREMALWAKRVRPSVPEKIIEQVVRDIERADIVLCPSIFVYDSMIANGVPANKCRINYFGVDTNIFKPRIKIPQIPRFVCVGNICLRKGHQYLFRAFQQIKLKYPNTELYCVGSVLDDFKDEWKKWNKIVTFHGKMTHLEISNLFMETTAFIMVSVEEGFSRAIIEALGAGLPIIATHESGATTLVEDGVEGIIVKSRNINQIFNAMEKLILNPELSLIYGRNSSLKGQNNNTWDDYGKRNIEIFNEFLNR